MLEGLFTLFDHVVSGRDLVLLTGGLLLLAKATHEIHDKLEGPDEGGSHVRAIHTYAGALIQIMLLDLVFSLFVEFLNLRMKKARAEARA